MIAHKYSGVPRGGTYKSLARGKGAPNAQKHNRYIYIYAHLLGIFSLGLRVAELA